MGSPWIQKYFSSSWQCDSLLWKRKCVQTPSNHCEDGWGNEIRVKEKGTLCWDGLSQSWNITCPNSTHGASLLRKCSPSLPYMCFLCNLMSSTQCDTVKTTDSKWPMHQCGGSYPWFESSLSVLRTMRHQKNHTPPRWHDPHCHQRIHVH